MISPWNTNYLTCFIILPATKDYILIELLQIQEQVNSISEQANSPATYGL